MTMYSGESRLVICTGTAFETILLSGGYAKFTASGSFIVPAGAQQFLVECIGAGGGGGAGIGGGNGAARQGGMGGGGGGRVRVELAAVAAGAPGTSVTVTVGPTSAGGVANVSAGFGIHGADTTFGALVNARGGGRGIGGRSDGTGQGGGGGGGAGNLAESGTNAATRGSGQNAAGVQG